ncbi:peptidase inhibitor family I36 protein [Tenggerimyces flavus]|uniref:Peptidase inhibitor family I36 protein n=1 Tax=Tenggerimyces flavus TaxID=1708749 RepID=A0ABV7YLA2_9ACTN|nr:peptidase inhibitor family I36 protein [Tenggerimyces flavus]MBM7788735.1 hypothetical protein [Tenggerimyces flavus]
MHKGIATAAVLGLAALSLVVPATAAQAGPVCNSKWGPRNGFVYAWDARDCGGGAIIATAGNSTWWGGANDRASSLMNRGFLGGRDIVNFYEDVNHRGGHACLYPDELYADDLRDERFHNGYGVDNRITSHKWVGSGECMALLD